LQAHTDKQDVGASIPLPATIAALIAVAVIAGGFYTYRSVSSDAAFSHLTIATGPESGTYHALGSALKRVLEGNNAFSSVDILSTDGSVENMQLIGATKDPVDLAFVQADAAPATNARLLTILYDEVLHILASTKSGAGIDSIFDLQGRRVAMGAAGSGTRELARRILLHFGIDVGEDLLLSPTETARGLADGSVEAAFMLSAIPSRLISEMAWDNAIRFVPLGRALEAGDEAHALELVFPGIKGYIIPRATYIRWPQEPVHTVSVAAMLVARKDLDEEMARAIVEALFGNRSGEAGMEGKDLIVARKIRENYDPAEVTVSYHPGATAYYHREQPPFFVEYAEALSLGLTLMLGIYSAFIALREWLRRRMKNRIDAYLLQVEQLASGLHALPPDELRQRQKALESLRRAAFADLIAERLLADEAFTILQNHLRDELRDIERRLSKLTTRI